MRVFSKTVGGYQYNNRIGNLGRFNKTDNLWGVALLGGAGHLQPSMKIVEPPANLRLFESEEVDVNEKEEGEATGESSNPVDFVNDPEADGASAKIGGTDQQLTRKRRAQKVSRAGETEEDEESDTVALPATSTADKTELRVKLATALSAN